MKKRKYLAVAALLASVVLLTIHLISNSNVSRVKDETVLVKPLSSVTELPPVEAVTKSNEITPYKAEEEASSQFDPAMCEEHSAMVFNKMLKQSGYDDVNSFNQYWIDLGMPTYVMSNGDVSRLAHNEYLDNLTEEQLEKQAEAGDASAMIALATKHLDVLDKGLAPDKSTLESSYPEIEKWILEAAKRGKTWSLALLHMSVQRWAHNLSGAYTHGESEEVQTQPEKQSEYLEMLKVIEKIYIQTELMEDLFLDKEGSLSGHEYEAVYLDQDVATSSLDVAKKRINDFVTEARDEQGVQLKTEWTNGENPKVNTPTKNALSKANDSDDTQEPNFSTLMSKEQLEEYRLLQTELEELSIYCEGL